LGGEATIVHAAVWIVVALIALSCAFDAAFIGYVLRPVWRARARGISISAAGVLTLRRRGVPPNLIIDACAALREGGLDVTLTEVQMVYEAQRGRSLFTDELVRRVREARSARPPASGTGVRR
jgi:hypothetical protein